MCSYVNINRLYRWMNDRLDRQIQIDKDTDIDIQVYYK